MAKTNKKTKGKAPDPSAVRRIAANKRASHNWEIADSFEVGMVLLGTEVKALRAGSATVSDAYAAFEGGELWVHKLHIGPYAAAGPHLQHQPLRKRKLLMKRPALERLRGKLEQRGYSLVVLELYFKGPWAKLRLGLGRGKRHADRRDEIRKADADRDAARAMRRGRR